MCGIAGQWNRDGAPVDRERFTRMRDTMLHRGPDDSGLWFRKDRGDVALGHRRLAIVDLSEAGRQPMARDRASAIGRARFDAFWWIAKKHATPLTCPRNSRNRIPGPKGAIKTTSTVLGGLTKPK